MADLPLVVVAALGIVIAGGAVVVAIVVGAARIDIDGRFDIDDRRGGDVNRIVIEIPRAIDGIIIAVVVGAAVAVVKRAVATIVVTTAEAEGEVKPRIAAGLGGVGGKSQSTNEQ